MALVFSGGQGLVRVQPGRFYGPVDLALEGQMGPMASRWPWCLAEGGAGPQRPGWAILWLHGPWGRRAACHEQVALVPSCGQGLPASSGPRDLGVEGQAGQLGWQLVLVPNGRTCVWRTPVRHK